MDRRRTLLPSLWFVSLPSLLALEVGCGPMVDATQAGPADAAPEAPADTKPAGTAHYATSVVSFTPGDGAG